MSPGRSTLTIGGDLTLSSESVLHYDLGRPGEADDPALGQSGRLAVKGDLTLAGTVHFAQSAQAGDGVIGVGYYRLLTYEGTLTDYGLAIGDAPDVEGGGYSILTGDGRVDLWIGSIGDDELQHWQGGDGVWSADAERWRNRDGHVDVTWAGNIAVFKDDADDAGATIDVQGTQQFRGLQFVDDGYRLEGDGALETSVTTETDRSEIRVLADVAEITVSITGDGGIEKTEAGTLILSGSNTYSGGTTIRGGTLQVSADENLGAVSGGLFFAGGTLRVTDDMVTSRSVTLAESGGSIELESAGASSPAILELDGRVTGSGALHVSGGGRLILNKEDNDYSGGTIVRGSTLQVAGDGSLGDDSGGLLLDDATLRVTQSLVMHRDIMLSQDAMVDLDFSAEETIELHGVVTGDGALHKIGAGQLVLTSEENDYTGGTFIGHGIVRVQADGALGTGDVTIQGNNSALSFEGEGVSAGDVAISVLDGGELSFVDASSGAAVIANAGRVRFSGAADAAGAAIENESDAIIDIMGASGGVSIGALSGDGRVLLGANVLTVGALRGNGDTEVFAGSIEDDGAGGGLTKVGEGTLVLRGANTYTGPTVLEGGTLQAGDDPRDATVGANSFVQGGAYVIHDGTLRLNRHNLTMGSLSGTGGTIILHERAEGLPTVNLTIDQDSDTMYAGNIRGADVLDGQYVNGYAILVKRGSGTLTLTGEVRLSAFGGLDGGVELAGGQLVLADGADMRSDWGNIGLPGSDTTAGVVGADTVWTNSGLLRLGMSDTVAELLIEDGGEVEVGGNVFIGSLENSYGRVSLSGAGRLASTAASQVSLTYVGFEGTGELEITEGSHMSSHRSSIGEHAGSEGLAVVDGVGSEWVNSGHMFVGASGSGRLDITAGGSVTVNEELQIGYEAGAQGAVTVIGEDSVLAARELLVGRDSQGDLVVADGAALRWAFGDSPDQLEIAVAQEVGSSGTIRIGDGGAAGHVYARRIAFGDGDGTLVFDHTDTDYSFDVGLASDGEGRHRVRHLSGVTRLGGGRHGGSTFSGHTDVVGGVLLIEGALGGTVTVRDGAVLGGRGTIGHAMVEDGGTLGVGPAIGSLIVEGNLTLSAASVLSYELGSPGHEDDPVGGRSGRLYVDGDLMLDGTLLLEQSDDDYGGPVGAGYYRLIQYDGALTDNGLVIGDAPDVEDGLYTLLIGGGRVDLFIVAVGDDDLQHWQGGDGTWSANAEQWRNSGGNMDVAWAGNHAVFRHEPDEFAGGTIEVEGTQSFRGIQFVDEGYVLTGDGALETVAEGSEIRVLADSAELDVEITGDGHLVKTEAGMLILGEANSYTGDTVIMDGTLQVSQDENLGHEDGDIVFHGGALRVAADMSSERTVTLVQDGAIHVASSTSVGNARFELDGLVTGGGALHVAGPGELVLSNGDNDYAGGTVISDGVVSVTATGALGTGDATVQGVDSVLSFSGAGVSVGERKISVFDGAEVRIVDGADGGDSAFSIDQDSRLFIGGDSGTAHIVNAGHVEFASGSAAAQATVLNTEDAVIDVTDADGGLSIGSLSGDGHVELGGNVLTLGGLDRDDVFGGSFVDDGHGGGLVKIGAGTLTLTGEHHFSGTTEVLAGTLQVDGSMVGPTTVQSGARLTGAGTVGNTTVESEGVLTADLSSGTLTVDGDLTMRAGSLYEVGVVPGGESAPVVVKGTAAIDGGTVIHIGAGGRYRPQSTYRILTAEDGLSGAFAEVTSDFAFLTPHVLYDYDGFTVSLQLTRNDIDFLVSATSRNQRAVARAVDALGIDHEVYEAVAMLPDDDDVITQAFDGLSGEIHGSLKNRLFMYGDLFRHAIGSRLRRTPVNAGGAVWAGIGDIRAHDGDHDGAVVSDWVRIVSERGTSNGDDNAASVDTAVSGFLIGADTNWTDHWTVGVASGYMDSSMDVEERASSASVDTYHLGLYGAGHLGPLAVRTGIAFTGHSIRTSRSVTIDTLSQQLHADYGGSTTQAYGELGYVMDGGKFQLEPFVHVTHAVVSTGDFTERGGTAALTTKGDAKGTTSATIGVRASMRPTVGRLNLRADGAVAWSHAFGDTSAISRHRFHGAEDFVIHGLSPSGDVLEVEAGVALELSADVSLGVTYAGRYAVGSSFDAPDRTVQGTLGVRF